MAYTITDLALAYRKAKVDIYYTANAPLLDVAAYEEDIVARLEALTDKLAASDETWVTQTAFLGTWTLAPKRIRPSASSSKSTTVFASPAEQWREMCHPQSPVGPNHQERTERPLAELRLMADCSMDFHVVSTLWMMKVGCKYDDSLSSNAYGNRLRRGQNGEVNPLSSGTFKQYLRPFREWRDGGIRAMRGALLEGKRVAALTADISSFYHELQPGFLLNPRFNDLLGVELDEDEQKLHRLFVSALDHWAASTPLKRGLPVGLPASAVVANSALVEFDRIIERDVVPIYYGRYVDDIILVLENGAKLTSTAGLWSWLFERFRGLLRWDPENNEAVRFVPEYLEGSRISFDNDKNKTFILSGETGLQLVDSLSHHINSRASEWRALPNLPISAKQVGTDLIAATQRNGEDADSLRKTDSVAMRRAGFAIKLRDFEAYERDLEPDAWKEHRHAFLNAFTRHVLVLPQFFDLATYVPRVVRLATSCADFAHLRQLIEGVMSVCSEVGAHCDTSIKSCSPQNLPPKRDLDFYLQRQLLKQISEAVIASFPPKLTGEQKVAWRSEVSPLWRLVRDLIGVGQDRTETISDIREVHLKLFARDLAHMPFRFIGLSKEMISQRGLRGRARLREINSDEALLILPAALTRGVRVLAKWAGFKGRVPAAFLFATRPYQVAELYLLATDPFAVAKHQELKEIVLAIRGFSLGSELPSWKPRSVLHVPDSGERAKLVIAVSSWRTDMSSWVASVMRMPDPDLGRYGRLTRLINSLISSPTGARYLVLPELAVPAHWFLRFALKLQGRGISLITGIQYIHNNAGAVSNQVWAGLTHNALGFPSLLVYRQDKQRPALHEELELHRHAGLILTPSLKTWKLPPVVDHAGFRFSLLVCSELTNIEYRASLRGRVDALFVPEWNQDTETFHSLVESAALDVHAFIVQCNDREYGDSRIRSPYRDSWRRDVLRVKGGLQDYCVTGAIDVNDMRAFQSTHRSPAKPFKPVPDGFLIDPTRMVLPKGP